jgi:hypothetical protein
MASTDSNLGSNLSTTSVATSAGAMAASCGGWLAREDEADADLWVTATLGCVH